LSVIYLTDGQHRAWKQDTMSRHALKSAGRNRLLAALPADERNRLLLLCQPVDLPNERTLLAPRHEVRYAYFPTDGVVALLMIMADGTPVEVATVGTEGFVSVESILGTDESPYEVTCQTPVEALRTQVKDLRAAFSGSEVLRDLLLRYAAVVFSCTGRSLACKVTHRVEQRLARWLLMTHDRVGADAFHLTHEFVAAMLGVRRPSVTVAAGLLQRAGLIDYRRGNMRILDRPRLEEAACEDYRLTAEIHEGLFPGVVSTRSPA
jgi:CRP-like cAMP-binding protein